MLYVLQWCHLAQWCISLQQERGHYDLNSCFIIFLILIKYVIFWLRLFWIFLKELTMKSILFKENVNLFYIYFCRIWILTIKVTVYHGMAIYMLWKTKTRKSIQVINKTAENQKTSWVQEDHYLHRILYLHDIGIHDRQT